MLRGWKFSFSFGEGEGGVTDANFEGINLFKEIGACPVNWRELKGRSRVSGR